MTDTPSTANQDQPTKEEVMARETEMDEHPYCEWCGTAIFRASATDATWLDRHTDERCPASDTRRHEPATVPPKIIPRTK